MDYNTLKRLGRDLLQEGDIEACYKLFEDALKIYPDDSKIQQKCVALREALAQREADEDEPEVQQLNESMVEVCTAFYVHRNIYSRLFDYQRDGLRWMWSLFLKKQGGVLGDDMGLGKTIQVIAFLAGLFDMQKIKSVLVIMPVSLVRNWLLEFEKWAPGMTVYDHHSSSKKEKEIALKRVMAANRPGVIITTYGLVTANTDVFRQVGSRQFVWDYLILDEGHRIKNPTKAQKAIFDLSARYRLILTGTAVQNNLSELWSLFHFTHRGSLFGSRAGFKQDFEGPINKGREKDATAGEREMGAQLANELRTMIKPFFLRRSKAEVFRNNDGPKINATKEDLVCWTFLSETQLRLYRDFIQSEAVQALLKSVKSPLVQLSVLKKICDHPRLLPKKACIQLGLCNVTSEEELSNFLEDNNYQFSIDDVSDEDLLDESGKMRLLLLLVTQLRDEGHRTLIFSSSRRILDIIQRILRSRHFTIARIDGQVSNIPERHKIVTDFQKNGKDVFLLTTQVGGVGLTLTNADRVIIYDPCWNPATDDQAIDRAFRIGQTRDVYVYRFITCGTLEEKIYSRQIFKNSIIKQTTGKLHDPTRYFTHSQLRELFVLGDTHRSRTQELLSEMHQKQVSPTLGDHLAFLISTEMVYGVSHHDLMFSAAEERLQVSEEERAFISKQVERARIIRQQEADVLKQDLSQAPYAVPQVSVKTAASRNEAARMPSTINPSNLQNRFNVQDPVTNLKQPSEEAVIDLTQIDVDEEAEDSPRSTSSRSYPTDYLNNSRFDISMRRLTASTPKRSGKEQKQTAINVDDSEDEDDISIIKVVRRSSGLESIVVDEEANEETKISTNNLNLKECHKNDKEDNTQITFNVSDGASKKTTFNHEVIDHPSGHANNKLSDETVSAGDFADFDNDNDGNDLKPGKRHQHDSNVSCAFLQDSSNVILPYVDGLHKPDSSNNRDIAQISDEGSQVSHPISNSLLNSNAANETPVASNATKKLTPVQIQTVLQRARRQSVAIPPVVKPVVENTGSSHNANSPCTSDSEANEVTKIACVDTVDERRRSLEAAAYDKAFEADDVDQSVIDQTILESSQQLAFVDDLNSSSVNGAQSFNQSLYVLDDNNEGLCSNVRDAMDCQTEAREKSDIEEDSVIADSDDDNMA